MDINHQNTIQVRHLEQIDQYTSEHGYVVILQERDEAFVLGHPKDVANDTPVIYDDYYDACRAAVEVAAHEGLPVIIRLGTALLRRNQH